MLRFLDPGSDRDFPPDFDDRVDGEPEIFGQMRRIALHEGEQCLDGTVNLAGLAAVAPTDRDG